MEAKMVLHPRLVELKKINQIEWQNESPCCRLFESSQARYTEVQEMQENLLKRPKYLLTRATGICHRQHSSSFWRIDSSEA